MESSSPGRTALVFGATGLVGSALTEQLLQHPAYARVLIFVRRNTERTHPRLTEIRIDFDHPESYADQVRGDDLFLCLGTTIRKAGSQDAFRRVDFTYNLDAARAAVNNGVSRLLLVSSAGADDQSRVFYSRVKGELEAAVQNLPFTAIDILQPSILLGPRQESRPGEWIGKQVMQFVHFISGGRLGKYEPVHARTVAAALIGCALNDSVGTTVHPSHQLKVWAKRGQPHTETD